MVIAVFFAIFAISMLYLAIGAGQAVLYREHLQDAADAAALSGAITHARIMNVLVLINMVMVMLLAILVTLKLIEGVAIVGMAIAAGLAWCTAGTSLAAIPPLKALQSTVSTLYEQAKTPIFDALETLRDVGDQIADVAPEIAEAMSQTHSDGSDSGIVAGGFAVSTADKLPVGDDSFEGLCGKAGELSWDMANIPLKVIPGWGVLSGALSGPMSTLTSSLSQWFCGDGQNSVPDLSQKLDVGYPKTDKAEACAASEPEEYPEGHEEEATSAACREADAERIAGTPDAGGNCQVQCALGGPYDLAVINARLNCDPSGSPTPRQYRYQVQEGKVQYQWDGAAWVRQQPLFLSSTLNASPTDSLPCVTAVTTDELVDGYDYNSGGNPCGPVTPNGYFPGYNPNVHSPNYPARVFPACTNECAPLVPPDRHEVNPTRTVSFRQVTHVFSCVRNQHVPVEVHLEKESPNSEAKKEGNSKSPKRVTEGIKLGGEPFQIRAVALGRQQQGESARLVRLSLWGKAGPVNPLERLRQLGGFSFAQAEYFYDGGEGSDAWMWNMNWRGRLKRFELPRDNDASGALRSACGRHLAGRDCTHVLGLVKDWKDLLFH